jgi:glycosyltransferase involved in cell wall biosynthesis
MARYFGIDRGHIRTVPLGITLDGHDAQPVRRSPPYTIGYFARIAPEKGLHVLADAYHRLRSKPNAPPTRLLAAGYLLNEHRDYLSSVEQRLRDWGLADQFTYAGAPDRAGKIALIRQMDVFSVPAVYAEPKGLSLLEAMANGVPIVQPRRGAFTEIVQRTGGGVLVAPDEPESLADALLGLLLDRERAAAFGRAGAEAVKQHYSVDRMAQSAEKVYGEMLARPAHA